MRAKTNENISAIKRLIPAIAMLALSAVTLSTSTYAWFTMSKEVSMTGLNMSATAGEGIEIALAEIDNGSVNVYLDTGHPAEGDSGWKSSVVVGNYYSDVGALIPASSVDGVNLYEATDASNSGKTATQFSKLTLRNGNTLNAMAQMKTQNAYDENATSLGSTAESGYYVDIPVHIRTTKKGTGSGALYYQMKIVNKDDTATGDKDLSKAVRVALMNRDAASASSILAIDKTNYDGEKAVSGEGNKSAVSNLKIDSVTNGDFAESNGTDSGLTIPYAGEGATYGYLDFTIRIWLEGESQYCYNSNSGQNWDIAFKFTMVDTTPAGG